MNPTQPLVSVLMTAYNRERYIGEAIQSVLENNYHHFELIIVDDGSKDATVSIARSYEAEDQRVKVFQNEKNLGDYPNRNKAVSHAKGDFFIFVDSDDKLNKDTIDSIMKVAIVDASFNFAMYWAHDHKTFSMTSKEALHEHFFGRQFLYMGPGGTFIRRKFFNDIGGYPVKYGPANDMYFNLKACCYSGIHLFPFEFIYYRIHEGQEINNKFSYLHNNYNYMRDALMELPLPFEKSQLEWLIKKNKRRFSVNLLAFFIKGFRFKKSAEAWKKADFKWRYFMEGIFQKR